MTSPDHQRADGADGALAPYLRALRGHRTLVALVTLAALAGSVGWVAVRTAQYSATAQLLVTPLPQDDRTFLGLQMIRDSGDPTRTVQTAAALVKSQRAAALAARRLGRGWSARRIAAAVDVEPVGESNILAVSARAADPAAAARLANAFAAAALSSRRIALQAQIDATIGRLRAQLLALRRSGAGGETEFAQLQQLHALRNGPDPTLTLSQQAIAPLSPSGAPPWLVVALALIAGLTLGTGAALLLDQVNRRIRDADEAVELADAEVLARVPLVTGHRRRARAGAGFPTAPGVQEAFRTLAVQLDQRTGGSGTVMVTSASSGDGKTTSAIGLAFALVATGRRVTLIDVDLRKPDVARVLGLGDPPGLTSLLTGERALADLLVQAPQLPPLRVMAAGTRGDALMLEPLSRRLPAIVGQARRTADYVVLDTPPLGEVSDALRVAADADEILVVTRPGHTDRAHFESMRGLLERAGSPPAGLVVFGAAEGPAAQYGYGYGYGAPRSNGHGPRPAEPAGLPGG